MESRSLPVLCWMILILPAYMLEKTKVEEMVPLQSTFPWGNALYNRTYLQHNRNIHRFIPEPFNPIEKTGYLRSYEFSNSPGLIGFEIWRPTGKFLEYKLVHKVTPRQFTGMLRNSYKLAKPLLLKRGDVIAVTLPSGKNVIPFDATECWTQRMVYQQSEPDENSKEVVSRFKLMETGSLPCRRYSLAATFNHVSMRHGFQPIEHKDVDKWRNAIYIFTPSHPIKVYGRIVSWEIFVKGHGTLYLQVWRHIEGAKYVLIGQNMVTFTPKNSKERITISRTEQVPVQPGDMLGFYFPGPSIIPFRSWHCRANQTLFVQYPTNEKVSNTYKFKPKEYDWKPCREYSALAVIQVISSDDD